MYVLFNNKSQKIKDFPMNAIHLLLPQQIGTEYWEGEIEIEMYR